MLSSVNFEAVFLLHRVNFYTELIRDDRHCNIKHKKGTEIFTKL